MSTNTGRAQLYNALKDLRLQWQQVQSKWKDSIAEDLEKNFWTNLEGSCISSLAAMDRLNQVILQIRHDCGSDGQAY